MKDLEMIKFCDFLDQQKEYRLADVILGNFNKTAMKKTYHSNDISFDKILDLSFQYVLANPNSMFMKTANTPAPDNFIEIFEFLRKLNFKYEDFLKDIPLDEVIRRYNTFKTATKSDPGSMILAKLYGSAKSDGGRKIIDRIIVERLRTMASTFQTAIGNASEVAAKSVPTAEAAASAAAKQAASPEKVAKWKQFCKILAKRFPKLGPGLVAASELPVHPLSIIFSSMDVVYMINRIVTQGWDEATDSDADKLLLGAGISSLLSILSGLTAAGIALGSGGTAAAWYGPVAAASGLFALVSAALNTTVLIGTLTNKWAPDPRNEEKKPTTKPSPSTKPTSATTSPTPQPVKPPKEAPTATFNPASGLVFD
jgi:hypothetical protein